MIHMTLINNSDVLSEQTPQLMQLQATQFQAYSIKKICEVTFFEMLIKFFFEEWKQNEMKVMEEYSWVTSQVVRLLCCNQ